MPDEYVFHNLLMRRGLNVNPRDGTAGPQSGPSDRLCSALPPWPIPQTSKVVTKQVTAMSIKSVLLAAAAVCAFTAAIFVAAAPETGLPDGKTIYAMPMKIVRH